MSAPSLRKITDLENVCAEVLGTQELYVHDPYDDLTPKVYRKYRDLSSKELDRVLHETWAFCSDIALQRILPEILTKWQALVMTYAEGGEYPIRTTNELLKRYSLLFRRELLRGACDFRVQHLATELLTRPILSLLEDSKPGIHPGSDDRFIRNFNSCAAILPSIQTLWDSWWSLSSAGAIVQATSFIYSLCGEVLEQRQTIVDTRDLSGHYVERGLGPDAFWCEEVTEYLLQEIHWPGLISRLSITLERFQERQIGAAWPLAVRITNAGNEIVARLNERFALYVGRMASGRCDWRAWQEIEG